MRLRCLLAAVLLAFPALLAAQPPGVDPSKGPPAESIEKKFLSNVQQVTRGMVKAGEGYFSPDGKTIVYQAQPLDYPFYQIFIQTLPDGVPHRISTGRGRTTCAYFSPDGTKIMFASSHLDPNMTKTEEDEKKTQEENKRLGRRPRYSWDFDPYTEIFECDLQGGNLKRLTDSKGYDAEGAYSKDGKLIAFCSDRDGDPDLYVMNSDGTNVRQLTNEPGYDGGPFISPDQKWVIFRSDRKKAEHLQIHVIGIDGKNDTALTDINGVCWAPYWHPTEPYIIWTGADHTDPNARPNYDLWLAKYEAKDGKFSIGERIRVTDFPGADVLPVFSPDGKKLMWTSGRTEDRSSQLFIGDFRLP
ncbi:biopolymer transporter Tol [Anatilimnocola floriformis]|uniref:biopolymer transporter Tol n=1 Tax=Anatilimnocola floriformis TaxID=2948575 RepID=UPI0020C44876|nr:biopolymer transporter Tol [Anatilimnocola floriformis]